jgi:hypothetical protein
MEDIYSRGSTAVLRSRNLRFSGQGLADYIDLLRLRMDTLRCLAGEAEQKLKVSRARAPITKTETIP